MATQEPKTYPHEGAPEIRDYPHSASSPQPGLAKTEDPVLHSTNPHQETVQRSPVSTDNVHRDVKSDFKADDERRSSRESSIRKTSAYKDRIEVHDAEKGNLSPITTDKEGHKEEHKVHNFYRRYRRYFHAFFLCLFTGWWIAGIILHRDDLGWLIPFLVWLCIALRIMTLYVPAKYAMIPIRFLWNNTAVRIGNLVPPKLKIPAGGALTVAVFLIGGFASEESQDNTRANRAVSMFGLVVLMVAMWATSRNRSKINWRTVIVGMLVQFIIAVFVLKTQAGFDIFQFISYRAVDLLHSAFVGLTFLTDKDVQNLPWFLVGVVPAIIFFVSFISILYYWGFIQWFIKKFAVFFFWAMNVSGAEAVVAAASPFIGQGESAMLIKPFINHLTNAEIHQVMCSGFATIAGSVLVTYIAVFHINPQALVSSCIMSIPASLAISKMRYPETEETLTAGRVVIPEEDPEDKPKNVLHAFANGAWLGLKIGGMIVTTLLCIIALRALVDSLLGWWGRYLNINDPPLTTTLIFGYICYPVAFLLGIPRQDLYLVGQLIGEKIIINEFAAYADLVNPELPYRNGLSPRSKLITSYALCGFANIGSLGTQIGVLSQLAPNRAADVAKVAVSALISGALSTLTSAAIAGMLITDQTGIIPAPPTA